MRFECSAEKAFKHINKGFITHGPTNSFILAVETADISIGDAQKLYITKGENIKISSRRGSVNAKARVTPEVTDSMVRMAFHFCEGNTNWLTNAAFGPFTKTAEYKACAVKIEKM